MANPLLDVPNRTEPVMKRMYVIALNITYASCSIEQNVFFASLVLSLMKKRLVNMIVLKLETKLPRLFQNETHTGDGLILV